MDDLRYAHLAQMFQRSWVAPSPGGWDDLLTEDVELVQPLLPDDRGRGAWDTQIQDVLELVPDLTGTVQNWSGHGNTLFMELTLAGTLGGKPVAWNVVDVLTLRGDRVSRRVSYFDSTALGLTILRRPRSWRSAWRAGLGRSVRRAPSVVLERSGVRDKSSV